MKDKSICIETNVELNNNRLNELLWQYFGLISFIESNLGMYGLDEKRRKLHHKIEKYFEDKGILKQVLHNLPKSPDPVYVFTEYNKLKNNE